MPPAVPQRSENAADSVAAAPSRDEVLARYRRLREISKQHHHLALESLSPGSILQHARRLGLAIGRTLVLDDMDELTYAYDLAIYTASPGRSRAIDRYARSARPAPGSDEALMLEAMCGARFVIARVEHAHQAAGLIVTDIALGTELWLMDEGFEMSLPNGSLVATRLYTPETFSMTAGVSVPLDGGLLTDAFAEAPHLLRKKLAEAVNDRRFAEALYRVALADGIMERMTYRDPLGEDD
jgi:hypothetical protein